ncbi:MAG: hypothetical protein ABSB15_15645 [Bryobacteraceae bacterium]|jgi:hypothetical protein
MKFPRPFITLILVLAAASLTGLSLEWLKWRESREFFDPHVLLSRFPVEDSTVLSVDVALLRGAGFLTRSKIPLEPEYKQFVDGTGFDYRRDLDLVIASFSGSGSFFIARGRFDWNKLRAYAAHQGGSCYQELCRVQGSTPERHISFLPLRDDAIALAVSTDDLAASRLTKPGLRVAAQLPSAAAWLSIPGAALRQQGAVPAGVRVVFSALINADRLVITLVPSPHGIEAEMDAACRSADDARVLASQLRTTTRMIKESLATNKQTQQDDLARMLAGGSFDETDRRVTGKWPLDRHIFDTLTEGM